MLQHSPDHTLLARTDHRYLPLNLHLRVEKLMEK